MKTIVVVSPQQEKWAAFAAELGRQGQLDVVGALTGENALELGRESQPAAMVVDAELGDMTGIELVRRLLGVNAMINTALVSDQPEALFHDETEGLGILMRLSPQPEGQEAVTFFECLKGVL